MVTKVEMSRARAAQAIPRDARRERAGQVFFLLPARAMVASQVISQAQRAYPALSAD
jgi:hypothetical protein